MTFFCLIYCKVLLHLTAFHCFKTCLKNCLTWSCIPARTRPTHTTWLCLFLIVYSSVFLKKSFKIGSRNSFPTSLFSPNLRNSPNFPQKPQNCNSDFSTNEQGIKSKTCSGSLNKTNFLGSFAVFLNTAPPPSHPLVLRWKSSLAVNLQVSQILMRVLYYRTCPHNTLHFPHFRSQEPSRTQLPQLSLLPQHLGT